MLHLLYSLWPFTLVTHDNVPVAVTLLWLSFLAVLGYEVYHRRRYIPVLGHSFFQEAPAIVYCRLTTTGSKPIYETTKHE